MSISASGGVALPASSRIASGNRIAATSGLPCTPAQVPAITRACANRSGGCELRADGGEVVVLDRRERAHGLVVGAVSRVGLWLDQVAVGERAADDRRVPRFGAIDPVALADRLLDPVDRFLAREPGDRKVRVILCKAQQHVVDGLVGLRGDQDLGVRGSFARYCRTISQIAVVLPVPAVPERRGGRRGDSGTDKRLLLGPSRVEELTAEAAAACVRASGPRSGRAGAGCGRRPQGASSRSICLSVSLLSSVSRSGWPSGLSGTARRAPGPARRSR